MITEKQISEAVNNAAARSIERGDEELKRSGLVEGFADGALWAIEILQPEIDAMKAENERLREALHPFASLLKKHHAGIKYGTPVFAVNETQITVGDLTRAKKELE